jgi:hypothetical protein
VLIIILEKNEGFFLIFIQTPVFSLFKLMEGKKTEIFSSIYIRFNKCLRLASLNLHPLFVALNYVKTKK